ncbi:MAG: DUF697 domain-containing protein, partial [Bacteroidota bacterium]
YKAAKKQFKKKFMGSNKSDRSKHADTVVRNHVIFSMGAGFIPIPVADIFAVSASQLDMIRQLCKVYEIDFQETQGKAIVSALTSSTLARVGAGSLAKAIPIVGSFVGGITNSVLAGASTYALGEVFKRHFEKGGTILDFDVDRLKKVYQEKFEKGKEVAKEMKEEEEKKKAGFKTDEPTPAATASSGIAERLKELANLKDSGILTEEEFQKMKQKLIDSL